MTGFLSVLFPCRRGLALLAVLALHSGAAVGAGGILILGDSISAAYGIDKAQGWVALMEQRLAQQCPDVEVTNASVSGETTAGGLHRLPALLQQWQPDVVVIELGGNDGLRGLPPEPMANNLVRMAQLARAAGASPILLGMKIPPNYGSVYQRRFERAFARVAADEKLPFVDFFLAGIGGDPNFIQADGIHPNAAAQPRLLKNAWTSLVQVLDAATDCRLDPRLDVASVGASGSARPVALE
jgi:acyl-CoA thioesterase-1